MMAVHPNRMDTGVKQTKHDRAGTEVLLPYLPNRLRSKATRAVALSAATDKAPGAVVRPWKSIRAPPAAKEEIFVPAPARQHDSGSFRIRSPLQAAVILLGIYVTLSLAIGGLIHLLTAREAAVASAPPGAFIAATTDAARVSRPVRQPARPAANGLHAQATERTVQTRACGPRAPTDFRCVYD
jgi:hypothetical protein